MKTNGSLYQKGLIATTLLCAAFTAVFVYRELFPEYRIYQDAYVQLEDFRSKQTGAPPVNFYPKLRQVVLPSASKGGPVDIDRCISCHVAMKFEHFAPTVPALDVNGHVRLDEQGLPIKEPNPNNVWALLERRLEELKNPAFREKASEDQVAAWDSEVKELEGLKFAKVGEHEYDMKKVLSAHPLIGKETRPFELHPIEEYGCTSCHSGNGRSLVTKRAHGPVYDGHYHEASMGPKPEFNEVEKPENRPNFASVFNHKPGHDLLFQTTPLLVGELMEAKCAQCHSSSKERLGQALEEVERVEKEQREQTESIKTSLLQDLKALAALSKLQMNTAQLGVEKTLKSLRAIAKKPTLSLEQQEEARARLSFYEQLARKEKNADALNEALLLEQGKILGSKQMAEELREWVYRDPKPVEQSIVEFFESKQLPRMAPLEFIPVSLKMKQKNLLKAEEREAKVRAFRKDFEEHSEQLRTTPNEFLKTYHEGQSLFVSQSCYACHRINNFSKGAIGPELTLEGFSYPWFVKESIVWPQADLATSTMPNFHLDHKEVESLMSFLMAQRGRRETESEQQYQASVRQWESKPTMYWELPVRPDEVRSLDKGFEVFATEGCASCHRLKGFSSNIGFAQEARGRVNEDKLMEAKQWFSQLIRKDILGEDLASIVDLHGKVIDERIRDGVRQQSVMQKIQAKNPEIFYTFYPNFRVASRALDDQFSKKLAQANSDEEKRLAHKEKEDYLARLDRVLHVYIQEHGLGREIGPHLHWSGVYRDTQWLMDHFKNPQNLVPKSIMPPFPFDESKFAALTHLLQTLGRQNRDEVHLNWEDKGFDPSLAYETHCSYCHGESRHGNGPVAKWVYPIPKNLKNPTFLRNLTKENAKRSIMFGVKGTPMPPWGQDELGENKPVLSELEIELLVEWLYESVPGSKVQENAKVPKWEYEAEDVLEEVKEEQKILRKQSLSFVESVGELLGFSKLFATELSELEKVEDLFEVRAPIEGFDRPAYYIKKEFYTPKNLEHGLALFTEHCAHCHGKDGGGNGERSVTMVEAKPRILFNLPWIKTRDDLRLLRSIKYGVTGTAMIPFSDVTTTTDRLSLVMLIRRWSEEKREFDQLDNLLYKKFHSQLESIEQERAALYSGKERSEERDRQLLALKAEVEKEKEAYSVLGRLLLRSAGKEVYEPIYEKMFDTRPFEFIWSSNTLKLSSFSNFKERAVELEHLRDDILQLLKKKEQDLGSQQVVSHARLPSLEKTEELHEINKELLALKKLSNKLQFYLAEAERARKQQLMLFKKYRKPLESEDAKK